MRLLAGLWRENFAVVVFLGSFGIVAVCWWMMRWDAKRTEEERRKFRENLELAEKHSKSEDERLG